MSNPGRSIPADGGEEKEKTASASGRAKKRHDGQRMAFARNERSNEKGLPSKGRSDAGEMARA